LGNQTQNSEHGKNRVKLKYPGITALLKKWNNINKQFNLTGKNNGSLLFDIKYKNQNSHVSMFRK